MTGATLEMVQEGFGVSVQDSGRFGFLRDGVPYGGPIRADRFAAANILADNPAGSACLEAMLRGPDLRCHGAPVRLAATGFFACTVKRFDGKTEAPGANRTIKLRHGDVFSAGVPKDGPGYITVSGGGIQTPALLRSRAPLRTSELRHGFITKGQRLTVTSDPDPFGPDLTLPPHLLRIRKQPTVLRAMAGPQFDQFDEASLRLFWDTTFTKAGTADRMGARLHAPAAMTARGGTISDGVVPGCVQVTPDGHAVLLLADAQVTGGYPKIACVIQADLPKAGTLTPGEAVRFILCNRAEAVEALKTHLRTLNDLKRHAFPVAAAGAADPAALADADNLAGDVCSLLEW